MKIGFVTFDNPADKSAWSGIIHNTYSSISKEFAVVWVPICLDFPSRKNPVLLNLLIILYKLFTVVLGFLTRRMLPVVRRTTFYAKAVGKEIMKALQYNQNIDVLFFPQNNGCVAYLDTNLPIIILQDVTFAAIYNYYRPSENYPDYFYKKTFNLDKRSLTKASHLIFASEWAKQSAVSDYHIDSSKISVFELGASIEPALILKVVKARRKWSKESLNLFFLGVDWHRKGGDVAVETNTILNEKYGIRSTLRIAGCEAPEKYKGIANVEYFGYLSKNNPLQFQKILEIYADSDIFLLPTRAEAAGIVFAEASAYGLPILTYDTGGVGNYVLDGENGYKLNLRCGPIEFAKKIFELVEAEEIPKLSANAIRLYQQRLNWTVWGKKFADLMKSTSHLAKKGKNSD